MEQRVFLVEDLPRLQVLLAELVSCLGGYSIVSMATTEAEAIAWLADNAAGWDLAIIDLVLDQGSGMGVLQRAAAARALQKIVVFSSYASPGVEQHCRNLGADAIFDKADTEAFITWLAAQKASAQMPS